MGSVKIPSRRLVMYMSASRQRTFSYSVSSRIRSFESTSRHLSRPGLIQVSESFSITFTVAPSFLSRSSFDSLTSGVARMTNGMDVFVPVFGACRS